MSYNVDVNEKRNDYNDANNLAGSSQAESVQTANFADSIPDVNLSRPHRPFFSALFSFRFSDMSIVHRLYMCVGITFFLFFVATCVVVSMTQSQVAASSNSDRAGLRTVSRYANNISNEIISLEDAVRDLIVLNGSASSALSKVNAALDGINKNTSNLTNVIGKLSELDLQSELQSDPLPSLKNNLDRLTSTVIQITRVYDSDKDLAAKLAYESSSTYSMPALYDVRRIINAVNNRNLAEQAQTDLIMRWIQYSLVTGLGIALCVIILTNITIRRSLRRDTGILLRRLMSMSHGDLRSNVSLKAKDEIGTIGRLVDYVVDNTNTTLNLMKSDVDKLYDMVNTNSKSISATNDAISIQRNTAQNVASATSEMETSVDKVTEFARSTLEEVKSAEEASDTCRRTMQDNITTTHTLSDRLRASSEAINKIHMMSTQIESIVKTIADIADQTNLLALNATIESARAGESGRGFAIVADEIRELAIKTAKSTKDVSDTITHLERAVTNSVQVMATCESEMDNSLQQSSRANSSIEEIMGIIATISDMSEQIVMSCQQQSSSASEINQSIAHISKLAEDSYEQMAELQGNMHALNDLATNQSAVLAKFQLKDVAREN